MIKHTQPEHHFLVCNVFQWHATRDLPGAIKAFDKEKQTYWIWYVPTDKDAAYEIEFYQPQVEGSILLQEVNYWKGKRTDARQHKA